MPKLGLIFALTAALCACNATTTSYTAKVNSWQGASIEALQASWGKATYAVRTADGRGTYAYDIKYKNPAPNVPNFAVVDSGGKPVITPVANNFPYQNDTLEFCHITLQTNAQHIIVATEANGTACFRAMATLSANPRSH